MKITYCLRLLCLLLITAVIAGCTPLQKNEAPPKRLEVEEITPIYSADFTARITARTAALLSQLSRRGGGPLLSEAEQNEITAFLGERILPIAKEALIYENEWEALLAKCEATVSSFEDKALEGTQYLTLLGQLYSNAVAVLGSKRAGVFSYEGITLYLAQKIAFSEERYEKYGYTWYLEDALRYRDLQQRLTAELNATLFSNSLALLFCFTPFISQLSFGEENVLHFPIYDAELLLFLQKQTEHGTALQLSGAQWSLLAEILGELLPNGDATLTEKELTVLKGENYLVRAAQAMPAFLALCDAVANALSEEEIGLLREASGKTVRASVLSRSLSRCEAAFFAFTDAVEQYAASSSEAELAMLEKAGELTSVQEFLTETAPLDSQALFAAVCASADMTQPDAAALSDALRGYCRRYMPYLTYVLYTAQKG